MRKALLLLPLSLAGCSNAPLVGLMDAVVPSHVQPADPAPVNNIPPPALDGSVTPRKM